MTLDLRGTFQWSPSTDPNDETFGDRVVRTDLAGADEYPALLLGEPYDGAVIGRRGARQGPAAIRGQLAATKTHHFDAGPVPGLADLGDVAIRGRYDGNYTSRVGTVQDQVTELAAEVHDVDAFPVFVGGDNSMTYANVSPLLERGSVGVLNFDAHLDCRALVDGPSSGTPYRQLLEAGLDELAVVGARHFETSTTYHDYLREEGGRVVTAEECTEPVEAVDAALSGVEADQLYVSVDLDVLEAAAAPGVSAPTPGGITTRELFRMLRVVASDDRLAGFEVVECCPRHDEGDRTAKAAARAIAHVLAGRAAGGEGA
jgi:formimidoylglutamase